MKFPKKTGKITRSVKVHVVPKINPPGKYVGNSLPTQPPYDMTKLNILRKFDNWQLMMLIKHLIDPVPKPDGEGGK